MLAETTGCEHNAAVEKETTCRRGRGEWSPAL